MDVSNFKIGQGQMAALLGIPVEEVRARRHKILREGEDWMREGNRVWFSESAAEKMRGDLSLPGGEVVSREDREGRKENGGDEGADTSPELGTPENPYPDAMVDCGTCKAMRGDTSPPAPLPAPLSCGEGSSEAGKKRRVFELPNAPLQGNAITVLMVYRTVANTRIVEAVRTETDLRGPLLEFFRVQVRSSENFVRGMLLPVRCVQPPDFFEFTGRLPRWRGKY